MATPAYLKISSELRKTIDCNNYFCFEGTDEKNVLCAVIILFSTPDMALTAEQFLKIYIDLVQTLTIGLSISPELHPEAQDSKLANDVKKLRGADNSNLLERNSIKKIANFITDGSINFIKELDELITDFEVNLLLSAFMPGSPLG